MKSGDKLKAHHNHWEGYRDMLLREGVNLKVIIPNLVEEQQQELAFPGARTDFVELCNSGCAPHVLAGILFLMRKARKLEAFWTRVVGTPSKRKRSAKQLESAALAIEESFGAEGAPEAIDLWNSLEAAGHVSPARMISQLRLYGRVFRYTETLAKDTQARSVFDVSKYFLASYVKRATGSWRDRNSSSIIADIVGPEGYNEVDQRMWRNRNYSRLDKHFSEFSESLVALGTVMDFRT